MELKLTETKFKREEVERSIIFPYYAQSGTKPGCRQLRAELQYYPAAEWNNFEPKVDSIKVTTVDPGTQFKADPFIQVETIYVRAMAGNKFFTLLDNTYYEESNKDTFNEAYTIALGKTIELR